MENAELETVIEDSMNEDMLRVDASFAEKILQLHETLLVRFGVMVIGPTLSGKTNIISTLEKSYTKLANPEIAQQVENQIQ